MSACQDVRQILRHIFSKLFHAEHKTGETILWLMCRLSFRKMVQQFTLSTVYHTISNTGKYHILECLLKMQQHTQVNITC